MSNIFAQGYIEAEKEYFEFMQGIKREQYFDTEE